MSSACDAIWLWPKDLLRLADRAGIGSHGQLQGLELSLGAFCGAVWRHEKHMMR